MSKENDWVPDHDKLYSELNSKIRATDEVSFKLLGFVPLLSGTGIFLLLFKGKELDPIAVIPLCIAGAVVTLGLYWWEQRNIKTCEIFRDAAAKLEKMQPNEFLKPYSLLAAKPHPTEYRSFLGKTKAERIIYFASIAIWIIPIIRLCCDLFYNYITSFFINYRCCV